MDPFFGPSMEALLIRERAALDRIFGDQPYQIIASHRRQATIKATIADVSFGRGNDGEVGSLIELHDPPPEVGGMAGTWLWVTFLGAEMPPLERDHHGRVLMPPAQQLTRELAAIERLMAEVFSDPLKLSDAARFVEERTREYNRPFTEDGNSDPDQT